MFQWFRHWLAGWIDRDVAKIPVNHEFMEAIQTWIERGNVARVKELIEKHPDAAMPYQREWLEQQGKKEGESK
jgi:hypothetical protein